jgi:hypothetical protein
VIIAFAPDLLSACKNVFAIGVSFERTNVFKA